MKIYHISDTHGFHNQIIDIPECDVIVHSGDFSNYKDIQANFIETLDFIQWYSDLKTDAVKILVAGNHDSYAFHNHKKFKRLCKEANIVYLMNESYNINGVKFFGSPYQPSFGNWFFQKSRQSINKIWELILEDTKVLIVHGPPKGVLDLSYDVNNGLEFCGCKSLANNIEYRLKDLKLCLFGHIHDNSNIKNHGVLNRENVLYANSSLVHDNRFTEGIINKGHLISI